MNETEPAPFRFAPAQGELQDLVLRDGAISALSFGAYRFWMKTHLRGLIWRRTTLGGDPFEYDGTALELLRGALIAVLALSSGLLVFNLGLAYVGLALWSSWSPGLSAALSAIAILPVLEFARFAARRYRLRRTRWRGLRFGMDGSVFAFLRIWLGWSLLMALTLGLSRPWLRVARERYLSRAMLYGDARFDFEGGARGIFRDWLSVWFAAMMALGAYMLVRQIRFGVIYGGVRVDIMSFATPVIALILAWLVFRLWCRYRAMELALFMSARRVRGVRIACDLDERGLIRPALATLVRAILAGAVLAVLLIAFATLMLRLAVAIEGRSVRVRAQPRPQPSGPVRNLWRARNLHLRRLDQLRRRHAFPDVALAGRLVAARPRQSDGGLHRDRAGDPRRRAPATGGKDHRRRGVRRRARRRGIVRRTGLTFARKRD